MNKKYSVEITSKFIDDGNAKQHLTEIHRLVKDIGGNGIHVKFQTPTVAKMEATAKAMKSVAKSFKELQKIDLESIGKVFEGIGNASKGKLGDGKIDGYSRFTQANRIGKLVDRYPGLKNFEIAGLEKAKVNTFFAQTKKTLTANMNEVGGILEAPFMDGRLQKKWYDNFRGVGGVFTEMIKFDVSRHISAGARQMVQEVRNVDAAVSQMRIATGLSMKDARGLIDTYAEMGKTLKATSTDIAYAATEWLKQGDSIKDAQEKAKWSTVLSKISGGELDTSAATSTITAVQKSYKLANSEIEMLLDQMSEVDMMAAVSVGGIGTAINRTAASAKLANMPLETLISIVSAVGETTQESMELIGKQVCLAA